MNTATKEMLRVALANDSSVEPEVADVILDLLAGKVPGRSRNSDGPLLLTMTQAAKLLGVGRNTFWRMAKDGVFTPVEITPHVFRYRRYDLDEFVEQQNSYRPVPRGMVHHRKSKESAAA